MYNQRFCGTCGEETNTAHVCEYADNEPEWCEDCGAELTDFGTCLCIVDRIENLDVDERYE